MGDKIQKILLNGREDIENFIHICGREDIENLIVWKKRYRKFYFMRGIHRKFYFMRKKIQKILLYGRKKRNLIL